MKIARPLSRRAFLGSLLVMTACAPAVTLPAMAPPDEVLPTVPSVHSEVPPAATATLVPEPAAPVPLTLHAGIEPASVPQGGVARVLLQSTRPIEGVRGQLDGRAIA